ncbi:hypothetical protein [Spongiibacter marinus]|uniref:hypothetical protein n=1 Tax=Spongiibacter marinus TaxID=354246 RepID=UPI00195F8C9F|nr:hypothetical protein [Spongiibacter marinus]MBM7422960.1 hypothetical protein [Spongiibacter marinus]
MDCDSSPPLPEQVASWVGKPVICMDPVLVAEQGLWLNYCVAVEDRNQAYWDAVPGSEAGPIAPPAMLPSWVVDHDWHPDPGRDRKRTLELHFLLKDELELPFGVVVDVELLFFRPVRSGDSLRAEQVLVEIGEQYQTRMGPGRRWTIAVHYYHRDNQLAGIQTLKFVSYRKEASL